MMFSFWNWLFGTRPTVIRYSPQPVHELTAFERAVSALVLDYNHSILGPASSLGDTLAGNIVHKIDQETADRLATAILHGNDGRLPIAYLLACIAVESSFDPAAVNGNFFGSNRAHDALGFDEGLCQLKLRYIVGAGAARDALGAQGLAKDPRWSVERMVAIMDNCLRFADGYIADHRAEMALDAPEQSRWYVATGAYNFGQVGLGRMLQADESMKMHHCEMVVALEKRFSRRLGMMPIFEGLRTPSKSVD
ncbi:MAG: transglycosylase SLT domain-containing protein [Candidatus Dormibacteria bacterium]